MISLGGVSLIKNSIRNSICPENLTVHGGLLLIKLRTLAASTSKVRSIDAKPV